VFRLGQKVEVSVEVNRPVADQVQLIERVEDSTRSHDLPLGEDRRARYVVSSDVEAEHVLQFKVGEHSTEEMTLIFTTPPALVNMQSELVYPRYTRMPLRTLEGFQQSFLALPGTRFTLGFTFSKELERATITWDDAKKRVEVLDVVGRYATISLTQPEDVEVRRATLQVVDRHGFSLEEPLVIEFRRQRDEPPQVQMPRHFKSEDKEDLELRPDETKVFGFGVLAADDFGVARVTLEWRRSTTENKSRILDRGSIERRFDPPRTRAVVNFEKVFEALNLKPDDRVSVRMIVQDNREPKPQTTETPWYGFFVSAKDLDSLTIRDLGFGNDGPLGRERIPRATRATAVKDPEGLQTREQVRNEFEANVTSTTQAPTVRGEHAQAIRDYFRLLSTVKYPEAEPRKP
jgi:hypothetical protein